MPRSSLSFDATLIVPGSRVCVAVSGGADSVALLYGLHEACRSERAPLGVGLSAVHVNHGLRGAESELDEGFVRELCGRLEVPLQVHRVDVHRHREATRTTLEEAARSLRYEVFRDVLAQNTADDLLTAHTLDEQAETVLMKLLRGAWTDGLAGIYPVVRVREMVGKRIVRPLLRTSRAEVVEYLQSGGRTWREDLTNSDVAHTRNRLRHEILPLLRTENPSLNETLAHLAEMAREEEEHWQEAVARMLPQMLLPGSPVRGGGRAVSSKAGAGSVSIDIDRLRGLDQATRRRILRAAVHTLFPDTAQASGLRLSFDETARLLALCGFGADQTVSSRPGTVLRVGKHLLAKRSAREVSLSLVVSPAPEKLIAEQS